MRTALSTSAVVLLAFTAACSESGEGLITELDTETEARLAIETPTADQVAETGLLDVTGVAVGMSSVRIDGEAAAVVDGRFVGTTRAESGIHTVRVDAVADDGTDRTALASLLVGPTVDADAVLDDAVVVRVGPAAVGLLLDGAAERVDGADLAELIEESLGELTADEDTWLGSSVASIDDVDFESVEFVVTPANGHLELSATVRHLEVQMPLDVSGSWLDFGVQSSAEIVRIDMNARVEVSAAPGGGVMATVHGVDVSHTGVQLGGVTMLSGFDRDLLEDEMTEALEEVMPTIAVELFPAPIAAVIAELDPSFETLTEGTPIATRSELGRVLVTDDGLELAYDVHVDGVSGVSRSGRVLHSGVSAVPGRSGDLDIAVSDDLLNLALHRSWAAGAIDRTVSGDVANDSMNRGRADLFAKLAPVVVARGNSLEVQVGGLEVELDTPSHELGSRVLLEVAGTAPVTTKLVDDSIHFDVGAAQGQAAWLDGDYSADATVLDAEVDANAVVRQAMLPLHGLTIPVPELVDADVANTRLTRGAGFTNVRIDFPVEE